MPCDGPIVNSIDRLYVLMAAGLNGTEYTVTGTGTEIDPFVYDPPLPQVVMPSDFQAPGLRRDMAAGRRLLDNFVNGTLSTDAPATAIANEKLEAIRALLEASGTNGEDVEAVLNLILLALG